MNFLPEPQTDFIYSVISEEFGLIGATLVLIAFSVIAWRGLSIARRTRIASARSWLSGLTALLAGQALINVSVVLGVLPNKGLAASFVSAGGSSMLISMLAVGILLNVSQHTTAEHWTPVRAVRRPVTTSGSKTYGATHCVCSSPGAEQRRPSVSGHRDCTRTAASHCRTPVMFRGTSRGIEARRAARGIHAGHHPQPGTERQIPSLSRKVSPPCRPSAMDAWRVLSRLLHRRHRGRRRRQLRPRSLAWPRCVDARHCCTNRTHSPGLDESHPGHTGHRRGRDLRRDAADIRQESAS